MLYDTSTSGYTVDGHDNSGSALPHASLWLPRVAGVDSVVIDPVHFMPGRVFKVNGLQQHAFIALGNPIERSEGWMRVAVDHVKS